MSSEDKSHIINALAFNLLHASDKNVNISLSSLAILESLNIILQLTNSDKLVDQIGKLLNLTEDEKNRNPCEKSKIISDLINKIVTGEPEFVTIRLESGLYGVAPLSCKDSPVLKNIKVCKDEESVKKVNEEISKLSGNRLKNLLNDHNKPKVGMTLFNMIHFQGDFCNIFRPDSTETKEFHLSATKSIQVPMMRTGGMKMFNDDKESGARIMYHSFMGCNYHIYVVVPSTKFGLAEMERKLTAEKFTHLVSNMRSVLGGLSMPKVDLSKISDFSTTLKKAGLTEPFEAASGNLSSLSKTSVAVDQVVGGLSINFNEFGANIEPRPLMEREMYGMCCGGFLEPPEEQSVEANEPFLLIISYEHGHSILSVSRVLDPTTFN